MPSSNGHSDLRELLHLGLVLAIYLAILVSSAFWKSDAAEWFRLFATNLWLLAGGLLLVRRWFPQAAFARGGRHAPVFAALSVLSAGIVCCAAIYLPPQVGPSPPTSVFQYLVIVILVPVSEEIYFRGALLGHLRRTLGASAAVVLVSVLFSLLHLPQGRHWSTAALSLVLCLVTIFSGSLLWAVTVHVGWNGASLVWTLPRGPWRWVIAGVTVALMAALVTRGLWTRHRVRGGPNATA